MKKLQFFFLAILSFAFLFTASSCGDDDGVGVDAGFGKVTATVDGKSWESKDTDNGAVYAESQGTHQIQAYHEDGSYLALTIFGVITSGSTIGSTGGAFQAQYKPDFNGAELYTSVLTQGSVSTITFSTFSESKVKGTFQFVGSKANPDGSIAELEVKNGSFDIDL